MEMNYDEFVSYLLKKYGPAKYDYFTNATCKTKSKRISRTKEGLFCHHIDEDKGYMLSRTGCALEQPFEYQKAERLVYCNYIEHLLLHILIGKNAFWSKHQKLIAPKQFSYFIVPGVSYICSEINLLYDQNGSSVEWRNRCFKEIENNFEDYIYILNSFIQYIVDNYSGNINQKIMRELRISTEDLFEQMRQLDVFSLDDVEFAIIETNGQMSIMKKPNKQQVDASMLGLNPPPQELETVVISDGEISESSLSLCNLSKKWLKNVLDRKHLNLKDIFIMTADRNENFNIIKKEDLK
jgi:hypothetical protein